MNTFEGAAVCGQRAAWPEMNIGRLGRALSLVLLLVWGGPAGASTYSLESDEDAVLETTIDLGDDPDKRYRSCTAVAPQAGTVSCTGALGERFVALRYVPAINFSGLATFRIIRVDGDDHDVRITVRPVNDAPTALAQSLTTAEDTALPIVLTGSDIEPGTLSFVILSAPTRGALSGSGANYTYTPGANVSGRDTFSFRVIDAAGAASGPAVVDLQVTAVDDMPVAVNDSATVAEGDSVLIDVLANDIVAEPPGTVLSAGTGGYSSSAPVITLNASGLAVTWPDGATANGRLTIEEGRIRYEPKPYFFGADTFTYTIADGDGDAASASVSLTVTPVNDPPRGLQQRTYYMQQGGVLEVPAVGGMLSGVYDPDNAGSDAAGNLLTTQPLSAQILTVPAVGDLSGIDPLTGVFTYTPPPTFVGDVTFTYQVFDGVALSSDISTVRINVAAVAGAAPPPTPGQVAVTFNLSNQPLEQSVGVPSNVLVVMDDSASMDYQLVVQGNMQGVMTLTNAAMVARRPLSTDYAYLYDLPNSTYQPTAPEGRVAPTEAGLAARSGTSGNQYGVWRARNHLFNAIYYNPGITYVPWRGQDRSNIAFGPANPAAVRLDPNTATPTLNLLVNHTYKAEFVPSWSVRGGLEASYTESVYIPHYYQTSASPPLAWNAPKTLVEIRSGGGPLSRGLFPGGPERGDCAGDGDPGTCTYAEEMQNFANWFQYYRSREYVTKASMGAVIAEAQDIRIGYDTISNSTSEPIRDIDGLYTQGNKKTLLDNIYRVESFGGSPLRQALDRAGKTFACETGNYCPRAPAPAGFCQQNFALLYTDGYWDGGVGVPSNEDSDSTTNPFDGGRYADSHAATLGDTAMYHYKRDLHPDYDDLVPISPLDRAGAAPGVFATGQIAMHQHMKTYSIAFGATGSINPQSVPGNPTTPFPWPDPLNAPPYKIDDMLHAALNGRGEYLNAKDPQQLKTALERAFLSFTQAVSSTSSAAFNSTSLEEGTLLYRGFYDLRFNTGELTATRVERDGSLAETPLWRAAEQLDSRPATERVMVTWHRGAETGIPFRHASLNADQKSVLSEAEVLFLRGDRTVEAPAGALRKREAARGLLGDIVNSSPVFVGPPRAINRDQAPYPTNDLYSTFASARAGRTPLIYVGANDGMLHGFQANTGRELFAFVPNKLIDGGLSGRNALDQFASPFYQHRYFVDLTPRLNDAYIATAGSAKAWRTVLIGGLGAGGKGYFALDVTDPGRFASEADAAGTILWEFTDEDDTYPVDDLGVPLGGSVGAVRDPGNAPVKDLGYAMSLPSVAMSNVVDTDGEQAWIALFGNGQNATAGIAKLFALFIDKGTDGWDTGDVIKLDTGFGVPTSGPLTGFPNGLGAPTPVDQDLNGTVDLVYAGDRLGNLFRFDISDSDPDEWSVTRLFTARYTRNGANTLQPVLAQPLVIKHPTQPGFLVIFGTGSYVTREDARNQDIQSLYAIWDRGESVPATARDSRETRLVRQALTNVQDTSSAPAVIRRVFLDTQAVEYRADAQNCTSGGCINVPGVYGWYVDLDMPAATRTVAGATLPGVSTAPQYPGERAIRRIIERNGALVTTTVLPALDEFSCYGTRPGAILVLSALTGGDAGQPLIDFNNDGRIDGGDLTDIGDDSFSAGLLMNQTDLDGQLVDLATLGGEGDTDFLFVSGGNSTLAYLIESIRDRRTGRLSWRELDFTP